MFKFPFSGAWPGNVLLLTLTYFLYFGQLGVLVPYLGVFLDGRGFSSAQIGELFAIITLARILGPNLWATLADKSGKGLGILQLGCLLTFVCFCLVFVLNGFWGITLAFALMMMFWTAVLPQLEVLTLNTVDGNAHRYSRIRLWGSVGFILLTMLTGQALDLFSSEAPVYVSAVVLGGLFLSTLLLRPYQADNITTEQSGSIWQKATSKAFICFMISAVLLQVSFGTYYGFFALYMLDLGYSGQQTGWLVALGVLAEVGIFLMAGRLIARIGVKWVLIFSLFVTALRWYVLANLAYSTLLIVISQLFHAFSFGLTHAASVHYIHRYFGKHYQSRGQAIYISIAFGVGGAAGNYVSGQLWQQGSGAHIAFMFSFWMALAATCVLLLIRSKSMEPEIKPAVTTLEAT